MAGPFAQPFFSESASFSVVVELCFCRGSFLPLSSHCPGCQFLREAPWHLMNCILLPGRSFIDASRCKV